MNILRIQNDHVHVWVGRKLVTIRMDGEGLYATEHTELLRDLETGCPRIQNVSEAILE